MMTLEIAAKARNEKFEVSGNSTKEYDFLGF